MLPTPRRSDLGGQPAVVLGASEMAAWLGVREFRYRRFPPTTSGLTTRDYMYYEGCNPLTGAGHSADVRASRLRGLALQV